MLDLAMVVMLVGMVWLFVWCVGTVVISLVNFHTNVVAGRKVSAIFTPQVTLAGISLAYVVWYFARIVN